MNAAVPKSFRALDEGDQLARDASIATTGIIYQQGLSFLSGLIVARVVGAADYGVINIARNLVMAASTFTNLGLSLGLQRYFGASQSRAELERRFTVLLRLRQAAFAVSLVPVAALVLGLGPLLETTVYRFDQFASVILWTAVALPFLSDLAVLGGAYRGVVRPAPSIIGELVLMPTLRLALILALFAFGMRLWAVVIATSVAAVLADAYLARRARADFAPRHTADLAVRREAIGVIRYSVVLAGSVAVMNLTRSIDVLILGHYVAPADVGRYTLIQLMLLLMGVFGSAFGQTIGARVAERYAAGDLSAMSRLLALNLRWIALVTAPLFALFVCWGAQVALIFGPSFVVDPAVFFWLAAGSLAAALFASAGYSLSMTGHHVAELRVLILGLVLTAALCAMLVPSYGQRGAAVAAFIGVVVVNLGRLALVWRTMRIFPLDRGTPAILAASVLLAWLCARADRALGGGVFATVSTIALFALLYLTVAWIWLLRDDERTQIASWVRRGLAQVRRRA
jgi:O-antigen/teichoic acid export membrane protein